MIDLHCHILPGIDDGAKDVNEARSMLAMQCASGVEGLYMTPHFYPKDESIDIFLAERERAWEELKSVLIPEQEFEIRLGTELSYCEKLLELDLRKLTLGESDYLLLELPGNIYPAYLRQIAEEILSRGLIPILAHVERYAYFREDPELLRQLVNMGALAQVSVQALFHKRDRNFSMACLAHGLAQIVASDAHNTTNRKPCMELSKKLPDELYEMYDSFAAAIWNNELPPYIRTTSIKKTIFGYR